MNVCVMSVRVRLLFVVAGLTHASVWAAGCSYMTQAVPVDMRPTAQMILHSLHHAFGRGCGALIGGAIINSYGTGPLNQSIDRSISRFRFDFTKLP